MLHLKFPLYGYKKNIDQYIIHSNREHYFSDDMIVVVVVGCGVTADGIGLTSIDTWLKIILYLYDRLKEFSTSAL